MYSQLFLCIARVMSRHWPGSFFSRLVTAVAISRSRKCLTSTTCRSVGIVRLLGAVWPKSVRVLSSTSRANSALVLSLVGLAARAAFVSSASASTAHTDLRGRFLMSTTLVFSISVMRMQNVSQRGTRSLVYATSTMLGSLALTGHCVMLSSVYF